MLPPHRRARTRLGSGQNGRFVRWVRVKAAILSVAPRPQLPFFNWVPAKGVALGPRLPFSQLAPSYVCALVEGGWGVDGWNNTTHQNGGPPAGHSGWTGYAPTPPSRAMKHLRLRIHQQSREERLTCREALLPFSGQPHAACSRSVFCLQFGVAAVVIRGYSALSRRDCSKAMERVWGVTTRGMRGGIARIRPPDLRVAQPHRCRDCAIDGSQSTSAHDGMQQVKGGSSPLRVLVAFLTPLRGGQGCELTATQSPTHRQCREKRRKRSKPVKNGENR